MNQLPLFTSEEENDLLALVVAIARAGSRASLGANGPQAPQVVAPQQSDSADPESADGDSSALECAALDPDWEPEDRYWYWDDSDYAQEVCVKRWGEI